MLSVSQATSIHLCFKLLVLLPLDLAFGLGWHSSSFAELWGDAARPVGTWSPEECETGNVNQPGKCMCEARCGCPMSPGSDCTGVYFPGLSDWQQEEEEVGAQEKERDESWIEFPWRPEGHTQGDDWSLQHARLRKPWA
ncbi:hypothetical protein SRHO_G00041340 [Serrasalmus rhombeus]